MLQLFFSHSTKDRVIASALKQLLENIFGDTQLQVAFSSDQNTGGGIPPGAQWLPWITERIKRADKVFVLLTHASLGRPWVLWESGAAAGVALGMERDNSVVPVTFGIQDSDIPHPFHSTQRVRGDVDGVDGVDRLLQDVNSTLGRPMTDEALRYLGTNYKPAFFAAVADAARQASPQGSLVSSVNNSFPASELSGLWATAYMFDSSHGKGRHVDLAHLRAESDRQITSQNFPPDPRTDYRPTTPFRNEIQAEVANRHVVGFWKNLSDKRYFGSIHLAVLPGEAVMEGHYTSFVTDVSSGVGAWKWVRIDPASLADVELSRVWLKSLDSVYEVVAAYPQYEAPLPLAAVAEGV